MHCRVSSLLLIMKLLSHRSLLLLLIKLLLLLEMLLILRLLLLLMLIWLLLLLLRHSSVIVHVEVCGEVVDVDCARVVAGQGGQGNGNCLRGRKYRDIGGCCLMDSIHA